MSLRGVAALATAAALAACSDPPRTCDGPTAAALAPIDRKLVGQASPYPADGMLRGADAVLAHDQAARRAAAWAAVERAVAPVGFAIAPGLAGATLPRWHTWYGKDDLRRMFDHGFRALPPDRQRARAPFTDGELDAMFAYDPTAVDALPEWPQSRQDAYAAAADTPEEVHGLGGIDRVQYSPGAARHLMASYASIIGCLGQPAPAPILAGPGGGPQRLVREAVTLAACEDVTYGPYFVGDDATLTARVDGPGRVRVRVGAAPTAERFDCEDTTCAARGAGPVWVTAVADADGGPATVTIDYQEANPPWAACLAGGFPLDAVLIKADWRRAELGFQVPVIDTDAAALAAVRADDVRAWTQRAEADPGADRIYTAVLPNGTRYRLAALHLMTKELDHWLWVTLWWSPEPDGDFGADRPAALADGVWRNYKMCVVTAFDERDRDPRGGFAGGLGDALAAVHEPASWCSNPMLEQGAHNATSSCIGCHQHGGTTTRSEDILQLPLDGRTQLRNNFPTDYSFAVITGDEVGRMLADEVEFWTPR